MKKLWEILVPRYWNNGKPIFITHHWKWDREIRKIAGGLTIFKPSRGHWINNGILFSEEMIPARILCTDNEMDIIIKFTAKHYNQEAILCYVISKEIKLWKKEQK